MCTHLTKIRRTRLHIVFKPSIGRNNHCYFIQQIHIELPRCLFLLFFLFAHYCFVHLLLSIQLHLFFFLNKNLWLFREALWMVNSVFAWRCLYFTWIQILNEIVPGYRIRGWQFPSAFWKYCPKALWPLLLLRALGQGCCHSFVGSLFLSDCVKDALCHWMVWLTDICYDWNMRGWWALSKYFLWGPVCVNQMSQPSQHCFGSSLTHALKKKLLCPMGVIHLPGHFLWPSPGHRTLG